MQKVQKQIFRILLRVARNRNIIVHDNLSLPEKVRGIWLLRDNMEFIFLNKNLQNANRRNFVLAHEIGHSVLHKGKYNNALYEESNWDNDYKKEIEAEADEFAEKLIDRLTKVVS